MLIATIKRAYIRIVTPPPWSCFECGETDLSQRGMFPFDHCCDACTNGLTAHQRLDPAFRRDSQAHGSEADM